MDHELSKGYVNAFESVSFQENYNDNFSLASVARKVLAVDFEGLVNYDGGQHCGFQLQDNLKSYGKLVDDQNAGGINNYSESILTLVSSLRHDHHKQWKSNLHNLKLSDFIETPKCNFQCKNTDINREDVDNYFLARSHYSSQIANSFSNTVFSRNATATTESQHGKAFTSKQQQAMENRDQDNGKFKGNYFKTAKDELQQQQVKKRGQSEDPYTTHNYGAVKKSLGTRKGAVLNRFQPPVKSQSPCYEDNHVKTGSEEEVTDERLKNIEPKMIELIKNEIMDCGSTITWDDIAGLHLAKTTIQEIVVWPMLRPDIFTGLRRPPKGILLFGPPGTGKTLIGKCIASQSHSTFFSISASSLTSKWIGDGEKMVRALFAVARCHQPAVIFIDEIDSLLSQRSDSEHESSRRIKTEFLVQLDGAATGEDDRILIIGATNRPQELDEAARRRLVKRLYIPLPDESARCQMVEKLVSNERHHLSPENLQEIARLTQGYSGADMKNLCQEASLGPIRAIPPHQIQNIDLNQVRPLNMNDFLSALTRIKSSVSGKDLDSYLRWDEEFGCGAF